MGGRVLGAATSQSVAETVTINYIATTVTNAVFIATYPCIVTSIQGRQRVNGGSGAQLTFYKSPNTVAAASGTLLHSGIFDASSNGTADANQVLTLVSNQASLTLAAGDSISMVVGGTMTSAVGLVQLFIEPVA